ncbi:MAG: hypothetical protein F2534_16640 [Actinobacteria bacterium]|uniref:Unannotated protein n=1 Tax=freshwater metagenome TaxID=449393 RepID=A0A6J6FFI1_9ZZZZ|nr:hypothetical protein [Actinomycetota bacterium]
MAGWQLPEEVRQMPGSSLFDSLHQLARLLRILRANAEDLVRELARLDDVDTMLAIWKRDEPQQLENYLDGVERRLYNFAAAVHSRVDYYRVLVNSGHIDGALATEYRRRCDVAFTNEPVHLWLLGLRGYMLHYRLPRSLARMNLSRQDGTVSSPFVMRSHVTVMTVEMVNYSGFKSRTKHWMRENPEIDLREELSGYLVRLDEFDQWFGRAFVEHHAIALEAYLAAREEAIRSRFSYPLD